MARHVRIYCDKYGKIVSIIEMNADHDGPPAGLLPIPDCQSFDLRLSAAQAREPLIRLHTAYRLDLSAKQPRLARLGPPG